MAIARLPRMIGDALAWLGGANLAILSKAPTVRGKFVQMGLVLLTTASIACVSMTFFIRQEIKEPESTAVLVGVFWGLVILNLDRFLVTSMGATRERRSLLLMAVPRLFLAIVISLVVSTPITLRLFQSDINNQLQTAHLNESAYLNGLTTKSGPAVQAQKLSGEISTNEAILDGSLPHAITSTQLQTAQQLVSTLQPKVQQAKQQEIDAYEAWQCELYGDGPGCANASNRPGPGPIAQAKQQTYEQDVAAYNSVDSQYKAAVTQENQDQASLTKAQAAATTRYQAQAAAALPGLRQQYAKAETEISQAQVANQTVVNQNSGTLAQLSALWSASAGNPLLMLAHVTILLLFFLIELLPVLIKVLLNMRPLDAYEKVLKAAEDAVGDRARLERLTERRNVERVSDEERKKADAASRVRIKVSEDNSDREQKLGIKANEYVAGKMENILDAALQQWSAQVVAILANPTGGVNGGTKPAGGPQQPSAGVPGNGPPGPNGSAPHSGTAQANGSAPQQQGFGLNPPGSSI